MVSSLRSFCGETNELDIKGKETEFQCVESTDRSLNGRGEDLTVTNRRYPSSWTTLTERDLSEKRP